jgi:signal transduction histidine kinase
MSLEQALSSLQNEYMSDSGVRLRICVLGKTKALKPAIQEQIYHISREAVVNALRHSGAKIIEVDVEYSRKRLRVSVRDNGSGIDPKVVESARCLRGMQERADSIGAQLRIWTGPDTGTEVEISTPVGIAVQD